MYKVYFNSKYVCIGGDDKTVEEQARCRKITGAFNIRDEWNKFKQDAGCKCLYMEGDVKGVWNKFKSMFFMITAAGGVVKNDKGQHLLIFRKGKWDLPKGKIEKKETSEQAAIREVMEECGVTGLKIIKKLAESYHIYELYQNDTLKHTCWYEMNCSCTEELKPQLDEGIEKAVWANAEQIKEYSGNMYPSVWDILKDRV